MTGKIKLLQMNLTYLDIVMFSISIKLREISCMQSGSMPLVHYIHSYLVELHIKIYTRVFLNCRYLWEKESELSAEIERLKSEVVKAEKSLDHATPGVSISFNFWSWTSSMPPHYIVGMVIIFISDNGE